MYFLTRACKFQIRSLSAVGGDKARLHIPSDDELEELLQKDGVQIYEVDQEAFAAAAAPLYEKWGEEFGKRTLEKIRNPE